MDSRILDESIYFALITSWMNWMPLLCGQPDHWLQWAQRPNRNWGWGYLKSGRCQVTAEEWENPIHGLEARPSDWPQPPCPCLWLVNAAPPSLPGLSLVGPCYSSSRVKYQIHATTTNLNDPQLPQCIFHSGFLVCSFLFIVDLFGGVRIYSLLLL